MSRAQIEGIFAGLTAAALWGGMYVVSKVILDIIPPFTLITLRLLLGMLVLSVPVIRKGGTGFTRAQTLEVIGVGLIGYGISLGFQFVGTKLSNASNGALVTSATPAFVLLFAAWILHERIPRLRLAALVLATLGVIAVIDPRGADFSSRLFLGNLSLVAAGLTWALYSVLVRKVTRSMDVLAVTLVVFIGGLFITVPASAAEITAGQVGSITPGVVLGVLYIGILSTGLAMFLWNTAFARLEAGLASLTFFAQPIVGAGLGALFLKEQLTPLFLLGAALIGAGLILAARDENS